MFFIPLNLFSKSDANQVKELVGFYEGWLGTIIIKDEDGQFRFDYNLNFKGTSLKVGETSDPYSEAKNIKKMLKKYHFKKVE